ncbi:MAG: Asp-tRNA(Asn)/Glu-tRNA(Gln) amidotransferase subunit GatC [Nitrospirales bacterium]|nr:Asp-tRNA(Asn)/Glu-tRNA(Gln) amidotransferase subunit GatC [Nitrospira sp.]MDR4482553.1 Asp-tRNA(Asn)/Glu-tRNA(Gln) amidotransferase subunit GatC [Nitrospirales bacterium]
MASITQKEVEYVAQLARLDLTEAEKPMFADQLNHILSYVDQLQGVSTDGVPLTSSIAHEKPVLRQDSPHECLLVEKALANAPESHNGFFVVPNILEK